MSTGTSHPDKTVSFIWVRTLVVILIWLIVGLFSVPFVLFAAPDVEARLFPIITKQLIANVHFKDDTGEFLLWNWDYNKVRFGRPEFFAFMMYDVRNPRDRYAVEVYSSFDCKQNLKTLRGAPQGERIRKEMCARVPPALRGNKFLAIDGRVEYSTRHPFYTVPQSIPQDPDDWPVMSGREDDRLGEVSSTRNARRD